MISREQVARLELYDQYQNSLRPLAPERAGCRRHSNGRFSAETILHNVVQLLSFHKLIWKEHPSLSASYS